MKKIILIPILFLILIAPLFSQFQAVFKELSGKVEVKAPLKDWEPAQVDMIISKGTIISTGFRSTARLEIGPSDLYVKQLTRMELEELTMMKGTVTTGLNLRVGKVEARVKTVEGLEHNFKLRSPISTAAVRGTRLVDNGYTLKVLDGDVLFFNRLGQKRTVSAGEESETTGFDLPLSGDDARMAGSSVNPHLGGRGGLPGKPQAKTTITIILSWP